MTMREKYITAVSVLIFYCIFYQLDERIGTAQHAAEADAHKPPLQEQEHSEHQQACFQKLG